MALNGSAIPVTLQISLNGVSQTTSGMAQVSRATKHMGDSAQTARKGFANLAGAFTGIVAASFVKDALAAVIKPAMEFETALSRIKALTGSTAGQLALFRNEALRVAAITPYGPTQMLNVLLKLQRALGDTAAAKRALEPTTQLAMASFGALSPEKSAEMVSQMVRGFGIGEADIKTASERTFAATKLTGLGIEDISKVMGKLATASTLGAQSFDEVIKMFVLARREMPSSERAATLLMTTYSEMGKPKVREGLGRLGIAMADAMGHPRKMSEVMLELADRYQGSSREVRNAINNSFGKQAQKPVLAILNQLTTGIRTQSGELLQGRAAYDYISKGMVNSKGILQDLSDQYKKTAAAQWQEMVESLSNLGIVIGEFLLPRLNSLANGLRNFFQAARSFFESKVGKALADVLVPFASYAGLIWAGAAALQGFGKIAMVVTGNLMGLFGTLKKIAGVMGAFKGLQGLGGLLGMSGAGGNIATQLGRVLGPIGLLVTAAGLLYKSIKDQGVWGTLNYQAREASARSTEGLTAAGGSIYRSLLREQQQLLNEKKTADELAIKSAKEWYSYIQLGTKQWMEAVNNFKGIIEYKPPKIEAGALYGLQAQFAGVEKATKGKAGGTDEYNIAVSARAAALEANRLLGIAYTNPRGLSPRQADTLRSLSRDLTVWGQRLGLSGTEAFRKRFALQALQIGTPTNIDFMTRALVGSAGRLPGAGNEMLQGWNAGVGGYAAPGTAEPYAEGYLKNAWGLTGKAGEQTSVLGEMSKPAFTAAPEDFRARAEEAQKRKRDERIAQLDQEMKNIVTALKRLTGAVDGSAIKVKLERGDPQGGGGSNDGFARQP